MTKIPSKTSKILNGCGSQATTVSGEPDAKSSAHSADRSRISGIDSKMRQSTFKAMARTSKIAHNLPTLESEASSNRRKARTRQSPCEALGNQGRSLVRRVSQPQPKNAERWLCRLFRSLAVMRKLFDDDECRPFRDAVVLLSDSRQSESSAPGFHAIVDMGCFCIIDPCRGLTSSMSDGKRPGSSSGSKVAVHLKRSEDSNPSPPCLLSSSAGSRGRAGSSW
mmetsp:Transcript_133777/g.333900  ORF Transcript_133777/g.333900 Transcript_133777/m.333900 type:complete len:223 (+) Transcript_133777:939-1607(+)